MVNGSLKQNQTYHGLDEEDNFVIGVFLYVMESGDEVWPDEHVVLFNDKTGESHWVDFYHFFAYFNKTLPLDNYLLYGVR